VKLFLHGPLAADILSFKNMSRSGPSRGMEKIALGVKGAGG